MSVASIILSRYYCRKMKNKPELYLCFVSFSRLDLEPFKVMSLAIAYSADEAGLQCIDEARREHPADTTNQPFDIECIPVRQGKLEQAAREVLGWHPPDQSK
jgi:hypothetical protein